MSPPTLCTSPYLPAQTGATSHPLTQRPLGPQNLGFSTTMTVPR